MNIFKTIYWWHYQKLAKHYPSPDAKLVRKNAHNTLAILFGLLGFMGLAIIIYFVPWLEHTLQAPLDAIFPEEFGVSIWPLLAFIPMMVAYGILKVTWGSDSEYRVIIGKFKSLDKAAQQVVVKQANYLLIGLTIVFVLFTVSIFYVALAKA